MLDTLYPIVKEYGHAFLLIVSNLSAAHQRSVSSSIKSRSLSAMSEFAGNLGENGSPLPQRLRQGRGPPWGLRGGSRPVSRVLSRTVIHLGRTSPCASSDLPGDTRGPRGAARGRSPPYLVLLRVGFTLPPMLPPARCALTAPFHPYPPAFPAGPGRRGRRYLFCGTFRGLAPPRRYLAPCPVEPGLSSPPAVGRSDCPADSQGRS